MFILEAADGKVQAIMPTHVDDLTPVFLCDHARDEVLKQLQAKFQLKVDVQPTKVIGMHLDLMDNNTTLKVHQQPFFDNMVTTFGLENANTMATPATYRTALQPRGTQGERRGHETT